LGKVLEKEGVTPFEDVGSFDCERQQVVDTRPTDDPEQDNLVCATVRPGYRFREQLVRPQEVVVYTFDGSPRRLTSSPDFNFTPSTPQS
jgi:molecular chaperone GrpE (heat shock protein)